MSSQMILPEIFLKTSDGKRTDRQTIHFIFAENLFRFHFCPKYFYIFFCVITNDFAGNLLENEWWETDRQTDGQTIWVNCVSKYRPLLASGKYLNNTVTGIILYPCGILPANLRWRVNLITLCFLLVTCSDFFFTFKFSFFASQN